MILLIDNYDSFTFNLYQYLGELREEVVVKRNDQVSLGEIEALKPKAILLSPGPGRPEKAGRTIEIIKHFYRSIPILGICLGHQAIGHAFGAKIVRAQKIMHGKISQLAHTGTGIFASLPRPLKAMRYHSLVIERESLLPEFNILATSLDDGEIMAIKHEIYPLYGLQFHPESIGTEAGKQILQNFLSEVKGEERNESLSATFS